MTSLLAVGAVHQHLVLRKLRTCVGLLVESADAFYIFKRTGKRKPIIRDFQAVRSQIRNKLYTDDETKLKTIIEESNNSCSVTH